MKSILIVLFLLHSVAFPCNGENRAKFNPLIELGDSGKNNIHNKIKLYVPQILNKMKLANVHFAIGNDKSLLLPIKFYEDNEFPEYHRDGYGTIVYSANIDVLKTIEVIAMYVHPKEPNGEITFCFHTERFNLVDIM